MEFDEFMKIEGCTKGRHLFVGPKRDEVGLCPQDVGLMEFRARKN